MQPPPLSMRDSAHFDAQVEAWRDEMLSRVEQPDDFPVVVVGNKV